MGEIPAGVFNWLGHLGVAFYLLSYALLQAGLLRGSGYQYTLLNLCAAALVLTSLTVAFNLSSALIQIFWIIISLVGLTRIFVIDRRVKFNDTEQRLADGLFPGAPRAMVRRFIDGGNFFTAQKGHVLTTEGEPVKQLSFLLSGYADVSSGGMIIGRLSDAFAGEINVLRDGLASATVVVNEEAHVFSISSRDMPKSW